MAGKTIGALIFGAIFAVVGYFIAFYFGKPILDDAKASARWPSVEGVIERSEVVDSRDRDGDTMYSAKVAYQYTVDGQSIRCNNVFFGGNYSSSSNSDAYETVNRYPVGKQVTVYYDPENASNAILEPGAKVMSYMVYGIGLVFCVVGLLMVIGPLGYIAFAALVIGGAATGAIGRRRPPPQNDAMPPLRDAPTANRTTRQPSRDDADDGIDFS